MNRKRSKSFSSLFERRPKSDTILDSRCPSCDVCFSSDSQPDFDRAVGKAISSHRDGVPDCGRSVCNQTLCSCRFVQGRLIFSCSRHNSGATTCLPAAVRRPGGYRHLLPAAFPLPRPPPKAFLLRRRPAECRLLRLRLKAFRLRPPVRIRLRHPALLRRLLPPRLRRRPLHLPRLRVPANATWTR